MGPRAGGEADLLTHAELDPVTDEAADREIEHRCRLCRQRAGVELQHGPVGDADVLCFRRATHRAAEHQSRDGGGVDRRAARTAAHLPSGEVTSVPVIG